MYKYNISDKTIKTCTKIAYETEEKYLGGTRSCNDHNEASKQWYEVCCRAAIEAYLDIEQI